MGIGPYEHAHDRATKPWIPDCALCVKQAKQGKRRKAMTLISGTALCKEHARELMNSGRARIEEYFK
ncbi:hypothetical protein C8D89_103191 [Actinomycetospora cinnamomea]|uniref:Uncharacterized protein n=1 Tax=Actinomycetospora cinnamomea TaxID=663609 RepID=A0A2U1FI78_9PSEU|nr:hypothetical protein C8D89_103191 [Actinomycetospora cinnamomea]